jgi:sortase A
VARELAQGATESLLLSANRVDQEVRAESILTPQPPEDHGPVALVQRVTEWEEPARVQAEPGAELEEPVTEEMEPVAAVVEPLTERVESVPTVEGPVTASVVTVPPVEERVTAPVMPGTSTVGSVTLDRPDQGGPTASEPADAEGLFIAPTVLVEPGQRVPTHAMPTRAGWFSAFTWIRNIGVIVILFVVWQLWGTAIAQGQAQDQLKAQFDALRAHHHPPKATPAGPSLIPATVHVPSPADGSVLAELQIPAIGVDQYVVEGTTTDDLSKGPGHYTGTAAPGQAGNVAIAGHRTTHGAPFNRLGDLRKGDRIILTTTSDESLTYIVSGTPQAESPNDVAVLNYFGDNRITLTTCTPEFSAAQRLIAVGVLRQSGAQPVPLPKHVSYHVVNAGTASWVWSLLPVVGIEVCLLVLLGMSYRRFDFWFGRLGQWIILVPLWAAGLYLLFDTLTKFLPASI